MSDTATDPYACAAGAHALVTERDLLRARDLARLHLARPHPAMAEPVRADLRNIDRPEVVARAGLRYTSLGRPSA